MQKTFIQNPADIKRGWHLIDAKDQTLGRMATGIATLLMGKDKPTYTAHNDGGDFVVVINAAQVKVTGKKESDKRYYRHSGYPGGLKSISLGEQRQLDASEIIHKAVKNMLPKNKLQTERLKRLKIYNDEQHPHQSQL